MIEILIAVALAVLLQTSIIVGVVLGIAFIVGLITGGTIPYVTIAVVTASIWITILILKGIIYALAKRGINKNYDRLDDYLDL